ncbi:MAG: type IV pilus assembly protein PilM [Planctomycetaceae bacterium]|jgi:type IV pilus assembly protein PilM|nr:type IV pilus assembly protein PilM [Planctomycetaceae bacterium]
MAKQQAAWGVDIGQCALKALRCNLGADGQVTAIGFDYIEYPKPLSQPDARPEETIREALEQFLSRNKVRGDKVAISVSGQSGLARFFRPPSIEPKLLPSIVKYEAKQQIPFQIDEVVWDWQQLGGFIDDGQLTDAEIGLLAMKREAVYRAMQPFLDAGVEVDIIQLSPIATYNMICHDVLGELPKAASVDPENPPPYTLVISIGTESTDVVISNGLRLWLRNIAIGGNHFTKQLAREMKLTHAKAEHLKLNSRQAEDPKAIFTSMRPVFADLSDELVRSLNYFRSIDRNATFGRTLMLGNASKLPGLRQFLEQQLELTIDRFEKFEKLGGSDVTSQKTFADNMRAFSPCYGLCIQALGESEMTTNLLPEEFIVEKIVRSKKPWVLSAVAMVMVGLAVQHALGSLYGYSTSNNFADANNKTWGAAKSKADAVSKKSGQLKGDDDKLKTELGYVNDLGGELVSAATSRTQMLRVLSAISQLIPKDPRSQDNQVDPETLPFLDREEIFIDGMTQDYFDDLTKWYTGDIKTTYEGDLKELDKALGITPPPAGTAGATDTTATTTDADADTPKGAGWTIRLSGHHYVNSTERAEAGLATGRAFVRESLLYNLLNKEVTIAGETYLLQDLGIVRPTIMSSSAPTPTMVPGAKKEDAAKAAEDEASMAEMSDEDRFKEMQKKMGAGMKSGMGGMGGGGGQSEAAEITDGVSVNRTTFVVMAAWMPQTEEQIRARKEARLEKARKAAEQAEAAKNAENANQEANGS